MKEKDNKKVDKNYTEIIPTKRNLDILEKIKSDFFTKGAVVALCLVIVFLLVVIVILATRPQKEKTYMIELNTLTGEQRIIPNVIKNMDSYSPAEWQMMATCKTFIKKLRTVSSDVLVNRENVDWIKNYSTQQARGYATDYLRENNPMLRCEKERVEIDIYNATPISTADSSICKFQVDWNEITRDLESGRITSERNWRADIDFKQFKATAQSKEYNPLGFYVVYLYISEIKDGYVLKEV